jgi:molybdopterin synthase catalytic subunit
MLVDLRDAPISTDEALAHVAHPGAGGIAMFLGVVRDENDGRAVTHLEYSAYAPMARAEMTRIGERIERELPGVRVAALHRLGDLRVGDAAIVCAASAPHRGEALRACQMLIDDIKASVPIWKREHGPEGATWIGWVDARCEAGDAHAHGAEHAHGATAHAHRR